MPTLYLLIGGNQGDRRQMISQATDLIQQRIGSVATCSYIYETAPWGFFSPDETPQSFFNQALAANTSLSPHEALNEAMSIEQMLGRHRPSNGESNDIGSSTNSHFYFSRPIDIDLIFYDQLVIDTPDLTLPHPRMHLRRFVLQPLCDIAPQYRHPIINKTLTELLDECTDTSSCLRCL
ncbi:MAG: 2-amino-4-hydroxy-6-hydroxymethyldihydropteridine diphosphokinase [Bacteroidales bacterium]|nr:2-amino-4-hydroxy-6-hydroxymethyldihydropteridine diphosphokinase [Bacteroidales bacterium]